MSLNSVVNNLVRAAAGISTEISDADLDQHVAKLLADEAKAREVKWSELGLGAFLGGDRGSGRDSPDPSQPKPNKRFLASVIRTVDGHNSALLRAQAEAARSARKERGDDVASSSCSRRGGAGRLFGGAMKGLYSDRFESEKGGSRDRDRERSSRGSRDGGRDRDGERDWRRDRGREGDYDYERDRERRRAERLERDKSFAERRSRGWGEEDEEQYWNEGAEGSSYRPEPTGADGNDVDNDDEDDDQDHGGSRSRRRGKDSGTGAYRSRKREDEERDKLRSSRWREERGISRREWEEGKREKRSEREQERGSDLDRARDRDKSDHRERVGDKEHVRDRGDGREQPRKRDREREGVERAGRRGGDDRSRSPSRSPPRRSKSSRESRRTASPPSGATRSKHPSTLTSPVQSPRRRARSPSPIPPAEPLSPGPPPPDSPTHPAPARISKMDKYFQSSYDPRLDLGAVPKEGLVAEVGWDNMLAILKERGKKKRHQSPTLSDDAYGVPQGITLRSPSPETDILLSRKIDRSEKKRRKEERKRRAAGDWSDASEQERDREKRRRKKGEEKARDKALDPASGFVRKEEGMMEVEYVKKGGVREWDKGK